MAACGKSRAKNNYNRDRKNFEQQFGIRWPSSFDSDCADFKDMGEDIIGKALANVSKLSSFKGKIGELTPDNCKWAYTNYHWFEVKVDTEDQTCTLYFIGGLNLQKKADFYYLNSEHTAEANKDLKCTDKPKQTKTETNNDFEWFNQEDEVEEHNHEEPLVGGVTQCQGDFASLAQDYLNDLASQNKIQKVHISHANVVSCQRQLVNGINYHFVLTIGGKQCQVTFNKSFSGAYSELNSNWLKTGEEECTELLKKHEEEQWHNQEEDEKTVPKLQRQHAMVGGPVDCQEDQSPLANLYLQEISQAEDLKTVHVQAEDVISCKVQVVSGLNYHMVLNINHQHCQINIYKSLQGPVSTSNAEWLKSSEHDCIDLLRHSKNLQSTLNELRRSRISSSEEVEPTQQHHISTESEHIEPLLPKFEETSIKNSEPSDGVKKPNLLGGWQSSSNEDKKLVLEVFAMLIAQRLLKGIPVYTENVQKLETQIVNGQNYRGILSFDEEPCQIVFHKEIKGELSILDDSYLTAEAPSCVTVHKENIL